MVVGIIKIHQSVFVKDLVINEGLSNCNANIILMKAGSAIKMIDTKNYGKADLRTY